MDILVTGHTHQFKAHEHEGRLLINPGSATGAPGGGAEARSYSISTPVPIRPRSRCELHSLRTFSPGASLRQSPLAFDPDDTPRRLSTPPLTPFNSTPTSSLARTVDPRQPGRDARPSFVLMDVDGSRVTAYVYELVGEEVKVDKVEYSKA